MRNFILFTFEISLEALLIDSHHIPIVVINFTIVFSFTRATHIIEVGVITAVVYDFMGSALS
jgi:hypothetical protein